MGKKDEFDRQVIREVDITTFERGPETKVFKTKNITRRKFAKAVERTETMAELECGHVAQLSWVSHKNKSGDRWAHCCDCWSAKHTDGSDSDE